MAANISNGNVIIMTDINSKSSRSMSIKKESFGILARRVIEGIYKNKADSKKV